MPTNQQRREAAKRKLDRQMENRRLAAERRRRRAVAGSVAAVVGVVGLVVLITVLSRGDDGADTAAPSASAEASTSAAPPSTEVQIPTEVAPAPVRPQALPATVDCQYTPSQEPAAKPVQAPPNGPASAEGTVAATLQTSAGAVPLTLDRALAPCTVQNFTSLAEQGYYDASPCHRLTTSPGLQVLQCGDPTGQGTGGPGYTIPDEVFPELTYGRGVVAMAKTAAPNTGGSQFFLVYGDAELPPEYTAFGTIGADGLTVVDEVARAGDDGGGDGAPNTPVQIESVAIG